MFYSSDAAATRAFLRDKLVQHRQYVHEHGDDLPEVKNWSWPY
jgi:xylulose-5-phosphate/fructose-6-phosphate phosphoketolase